MQFTKTKEVKSPCRANATDAGIDFFVPENIDAKEFADKNPIDNGVQFNYNHDTHSIIYIEIGIGGRVLIPAGIHVRLNPGTALILKNKSGVAAKLGLVVGSCVVDESYMGEVHLSLINTTAKPIMIEAGQKIVQGVIFNVNQDMPEECEDLETLYEGFESDRGTGGFGSSGEK